MTGNLDPGWAAVLIAGAGLGLAELGRVRAQYRREGKVDAILERLTDGQEDLDNRVRVLERRPPRPRRTGKHRAA